MKVLMLGWELPPHNSGGLGVACYYLCRALAGSDIKIQFVLPYTAEHGIDFMEVTAADTQDAWSLLRSGSAYDSERYIQVGSDGSITPTSLYEQQALYEHNIDRLVESCEFDLIHAHDWLTFRAALAAKRISGKPLIVHIHATEHDRAGGTSGGNGLVRDIEYQAMMMADQVVTVSEATKNVITEHYRVPAGKIQVVHNSIDLEQDASNGPNVYRYLDDMKAAGWRVVVNVGRLTLQKGLTHLLRAAQDVIQHEPKTFFLIVGTGDQYEELVELAAELGISRNILFAGWQRGRAWADAYRVGDLFVMPSVSEPFGLAALEAVRFGTPALVSKQSGVAEVIKNLLCVDYWDEREMANQITAALRSSGLRQTLQEASQHELERLSWDKSAAKLKNLYLKHAGGAS